MMLASGPYIVEVIEIMSGDRGERFAFVEARRGRLRFRGRATIDIRTPDVFLDRVEPEVGDLLLCWSLKQRSKGLRLYHGFKLRRSQIPVQHFGFVFG